MRRSWLIVGLFAGLAGACGDDGTDPVEGFPDVAGDFLMTIRPSFSDGPVFRFRVTYTIGQVAAELGYQATALGVDDGQPIGDPIPATGLPLAADGSFEGTFDGLVPAEANPFTRAAAFADAEKRGRIVDTDLLCGTMTGEVGAAPLDGATWASVRITGATLPAPVEACPP